MTISVSFEEHEDSPKESGDRSGKFNFTRIFVTDWEDRWVFLQELFNSGPFGLPASYSSLWVGVLADTFTIDRMVNAPASAAITDPNTQQLTHSTKAKITVTYSPLPNDATDPGDEQVPQGTWITYNQSQTVEFVAQSSRGMKWDSDNDKLPADIHPVLPQMLATHQITWHQLTSVPWVYLSNMRGKVNSAATRLPGSPQVFAAETLLFEGFDDEITINFEDNSPSRKLTLRFTEKAQHFLTTGTSGGASSGTVYGWNHQYREDTGGYDKPVNQSDGSELFQKTDFNGLWTASA